MSFNLRAKKAKRPLERLRSLSDDCAHLRPSDLDGMSDDEMKELWHRMPKSVAVKIAVHGDGSTFFPVAPDFDPYKTSPLVNSAPQFGGRWRGDMPGGGDSHISDDGDKTKDTTTKNDPSTKKHRINILVDSIRGPKFLVRLVLKEDEEPSEDRAREMFGDEGLTDGRSVYVECEGFEQAIRLQKKFPNAIIESKG